MFQPLWFPWLAPAPPARIGAHTYHCPNFTLLKWFPHEEIIIGKYCSIADHVVIATGGMRRTDVAALYPLDGKRTYRSTDNTTIGNDVWIGYRAMVFGGVTVGDGAVIAAGSVVFSNVPPYAIVSGNPAQIMRYRFSPPIVERLLRIAWWDWPDDKVQDNIDWFYKPITEFVEHFDPALEAKEKDCTDER